jgi:hypothetical protein
MTYKEILEKLQEKFPSVEEFAGEYDYGKEPFKIEGLEELGDVSVIEHYGGEGKGDTYYTIWYFKDHDVYLRIDGFYSSYNGVDWIQGWDGASEVKPKQKTITVYE